MTESNDNIIDRDASSVLDHFTTTRTVRTAITGQLRTAMANEHDLDRKNLLQAAMNLLQLDDKNTVHFETRERGT